MESKTLRVAKDVKAPMPATESEEAKVKESLKGEVASIAKEADDPAFLEAMKDGAEKGRVVIAAELEAADWNLKIGHRMKHVAAVPIDIDVKRAKTGGYYRFWVRDKNTGDEGNGTIQTEEFLAMEKTPRALGKWLRRLVNAALGQRLDR